MTEPLTPPEADLQDFPFMPLHVARLRDSDLAAEGHPEACWYAVLLWSAAWHQLPAGSLPSAEAVLARLCGLGRDLKTFRKHRGDAMRGWIECDDGRLYHPVVAEQVNSSWAEKLAYRDRKAKRIAIAEKAADARWHKSKEEPDADAERMHDASDPDAPSIADAMPKGRGTGTGNILPFSNENGTTGDYAFAGRVIKLKPADLAKWQQSYPGVDVSAHLQSRDDWLATEADDDTRKKWFISTSNHLANLQQRAKSAQATVPVC